MWHKVSIDQLINSEPPYNDHIPDKRSFNLGSNCFVLLQCDNKRAKAITARKVFTIDCRVLCLFMTIFW